MEQLVSANDKFRETKWQLKWRHLIPHLNRMWYELGSFKQNNDVKSEGRCNRTKGKSIFTIIQWPDTPLDHYLNKSEISETILFRWPTVNLLIGN